jgi:hypothetical protein
MQETPSLKRKMAKDLLTKADELIQANKTAEEKQCLLSSQQLEQDIRSLERKLNKEPEKEEEKPKEEREKDNVTDLGEWKRKTIFKPMEMDRVTGDYKILGWEKEGTEKPQIRRRKTL